MSRSAKDVKIELAIFLLQNGAVSFEKAAEIANMGILEFLELLKSRGIKPFEAKVEDIDEVSNLFEDEEKA